MIEQVKAMRKRKLKEIFSRNCKLAGSFTHNRRPTSKGQAMVEFVLIFVLFMAIAWIPADFGLAFLTGQLAQNASREGARIGAADPALAAVTTSCTVGTTCNTAPLNSVRREVAERLSSALLSNGIVTVTRNAETTVNVTCDSVVSVRVQGNYNYMFFGLLRYFGVPVPASLAVDRTTVMRWEFQC